MALKHELLQAIETAVMDCRSDNSLPTLDPETGNGFVPEIETPRNPAHGDYSTNIALTLARAARRGDEARPFAERLAARLNRIATSVPPSGRARKFSALVVRVINGRPTPRRPAGRSRAGRG